MGVVQDRIYRIITIDEEPGIIKFACGFRSGKLKIFSYSTELVELSENNSDRSIYDVIFEDIDSCGEKEIIVAGELHLGKADIGFLKIFKLVDNRLLSHSEITCKKQILSVRSYHDDVSGEEFLLASGIGQALIGFKIVDSEKVISLISSLGQQIKDNPGKYCFFVGAGFYLPCLPLADDLSDAIIFESGIRRDDIFNDLKRIAEAQKILENTKTSKDRIPLEAILYWYKEHYDRDLMIKTLKKALTCNYKEKIPNHIGLLTGLLKHSYVHYIFSVNYDRLIEDSTDEILSLAYDSEFISTNIVHKKVIFKFHGSIEKPDSIVGSLDEVGIFKGNKKATLDFLFNGHTIIFVGYSCRDPDLGPALEEIVRKHGTSCYFVNPDELNPESKKILDVSGKGDIQSRHFQIDADSFFQYLTSKMNIVLDDVVTHNENEVK